MSAIFNIASRPAALAVARVLNPTGGQWTGSQQPEHSRTSVDGGAQLNRNAYDPPLTTPQHAQSQGDSPSRELRDFSLFRRSSVPAPAFWLHEQARGLRVQSADTIQARFLGERISESNSAPSAAATADAVDWDYWQEASSSYSSTGSDDFHRLECVAADDVTSATMSVHAPSSVDDHPASPSNLGNQTSKLDANFDNTSMAFLGRGAFGSVIRATSKCDGQTYAVKVVLLPSSEQTEEEQPEQPCILAREAELDSIPSRKTSAASEWNVATQSACGQNTAVDEENNFTTRISSGGKFDENERGWALGEARAMASIAPHPHVVRYFGSWIDEAPSPQSSLACQASLPGSAAGHLIANGVGELSTESISGGHDSIGSISSVGSQMFKLAAEGDPCSHTFSKSGCNRDADAIAEKALFIQMAVCEGPTLADWLADRRTTAASRPGEAFGVTRAVDELLAFRQVVNAVSHVHSQGWAHLDLSPRNVFGVPSGNGNTSTEMQSKGSVEATSAQAPMHWCLGDFSFARPLADGLDLTRPTGTYLYAAPELGQHNTSAQAQSSSTGVIAEGDGVDIGDHKAAAEEAALESPQPTGSAADVFSLGVMLVECCLNFSTGMERAVTLESLLYTGCPPPALGDVFVTSASSNVDSAYTSMGTTIRAALHSLVAQMVCLDWSVRPSAHDVLVMLDNIIETAETFAAVETSANSTVSSVLPEERGQGNSTAEEAVASEESGAGGEISVKVDDDLTNQHGADFNERMEVAPAAWKTLNADLKTVRAHVTTFCTAAAAASTSAPLLQKQLDGTLNTADEPTLRDVPSTELALADVAGLREELRRWRDLLNGPAASVFLG